MAPFDVNITLTIYITIQRLYIIFDTNTDSVDQRYYRVRNLYALRSSLTLRFHYQLV